MAADAPDFARLAWDDPRWDPPPRRGLRRQRRVDRNPDLAPPTDAQPPRRRARHRRRRARWRRVAAITIALATAAAGATAFARLYDRYHARPGGTPAMVAHRTPLPSCGHYRDKWTMTAPPADYRPTRAEAAADRCLLAAFTDGRPAELTVSGGPDDIGHTARTFFRVVGRRTVDVIWEDIPPHGRVEAAELTGCNALGEVHGLLEAFDCHPAYPSYG